MNIRCMRLLLTLACVFWSAILFAGTIEKNGTTNKSKLAIYNTTSRTEGYARKRVIVKSDKTSEYADGYIRKRGNVIKSYRVKSTPEIVDGYARKEVNIDRFIQNKKKGSKTARRNIDYDTTVPRSTPHNKRTKERTDERDVKYLTIVNADENTDQSSIETEDKAGVNKTLPLSLFQQTLNNK